jgi:hypothetical protein
MWLEIAKDAAPDPKETWIRDLYQRDFDMANDDERQEATALHDARAKHALPSVPVRDVVKAFLKPLGPLLGSATPAQ